MLDPTNPPLWKAMETAFLAGRNPGYCDRRGYAAELRVIAERISDDFATGVVGDDPVMEVVNWLCDESDRAEAEG